MQRGRVLLAEDHPAVAHQLRGVLQDEFDVLLVADGYALVGTAQTLRPDVIVADIALPGLDGLAAAEAILKNDTSARIVFVTVHRESALVHRAMEIGALGYVLKPNAGEDLLPAVSEALRGERFVSANAAPEMYAAVFEKPVPDIKGDRI